MRARIAAESTSALGLAHGERTAPLARNTVLIDYRVEGDRVVIHELRRILGVAGTRAPVPIARFRYRSSSGDWLLDYFEEGLWRRYRPLPRSQSFLELLREFDLDPIGLFWGRLDGKSLRWCSSRGRCIDCDLRYKQVLGLAAPLLDTPAKVLSVPSVRR
ncbi:MAG: DUF3024 domain-containing protein [Gammaproteobacteria bacterium]|nr:DUF3024 domain-containing protein [Gammaproteobacteria bacterium]